MSLSTLADSVVSGTFRQILAENDQLWAEKSADPGESGRNA
jgi:hypothetical protein